MALKLGSSAASALRLGSASVSKVYLGSTEVWPPAAACTQASLLLAFDGADLDTTTTDASQSAHAVTFHGNAIISTAQSKWGGSSLYLDGSSHLSIPYSADFDFGTGDFTIEAWVRPDAGYNTNISSPRPLVAGGGFPSGWATYLYGGSTVPGAIDFAANTGSWGGASLAACPPAGQWHHVAFVRSAGVMTLYINGLSMGSSSAFSGSIASALSSLTIGNDSTYYFTGYIDDLRITPLAVYAASFSPPTGPLTACVNAVAPIEEPSVLLLHLDGSNASTTITDDSVEAQTCYARDSGALTDADQKFGPTSYSDGYISVSSPTNWAYAGNDWTIELWFKINALESEGNDLHGLFGHRNDDSTTYGVLATVEHSGLVRLFFPNSTATGWDWTLFALNSGLDATAGQWNHFALVRRGSNLRAYLNGIGGITFTASGDIGTAGNFNIGAYADEDINAPVYGRSVIDGLLDECRVTIGLAVYQGDFNVPTASLSATVVPSNNFIAYGTLISSECVSGDLVGTYADGYGGRYTETISAGSC